MRELGFIYKHQQFCVSIRECAWYFHWLQAEVCLVCLWDAALLPGCPLPLTFSDFNRI